MKDNPLVSILMTCYNREKYIEEAIESVVLSTYTNFELIIVDDGSKDKTHIIAKKFEAEDKRVKVYANERNLGDYPNRNKAASYANGEYLMFVDSDDKIYSDGIERCINAMLLFPEANFAMFSPYGEDKPYMLSSTAVLRKHFFEKQVLMTGPGGTVIKRVFFNSLKGYPEKYGPANDMYFSLKAVSQTSIVLLPFEFHFYRIHEGQELNNHFNYLYNRYIYLRDIFVDLKLPVSPDELKWLNKKNKRRFVVNLTKFVLQHRDFVKTRYAIRKANFKIKDFYQGIFHI